MDNIESQSPDMLANDAPVENSFPSFAETVASVVPEVPSVAETSPVTEAPIDYSRGPFVKADAQESLQEMQETGEKLIEAEEIAKQAIVEIEALRGVSPVIVEASRKALEANARSLDRKASHASLEGKFWGFVSKLPISRSASIAARERAESSLGAAVDVVRESGELHRAMSPRAEVDHERSLAAAKLTLEKGLEPRKLTLREKIFNYANEKMLSANFKHERYLEAASIVKRNIKFITGKIEGELGGMDFSETMGLFNKAADLGRAQVAFERATQDAQDANYTG